MLYFRGGQALSHFRIEQLLAEISYEVPQANYLQAHFVHLIDLQPGIAELSDQEIEILLDLFDYGTSFEKMNVEKLNAEKLEDKIEDEEAVDGTLIFVAPREGTISPWSSKATDVALHCGLTSIRRIERGIAYSIEANDRLTWGDIQAISHLLYDRMTEQVFYKIEEAASLFQSKQRKSLHWTNILEEGINSLNQANEALALGLSQEELEYLMASYQSLNRNPSDVELMMFAQLNSEHCRHKIFKSQWVINDILKPQALFSMIKNTYLVNPRGILSAYHDNAAVFFGNIASFFFPDPNQNQYRYHEEPVHIVIKVETCNHPTSISPASGAATGIAGELRDETAVGRGAKSKAGLTGFAVSNLRIPEFIHPWEHETTAPERLATPLNIMLEAPMGASQYSNEFGRPTLCGYFRTFEQVIPKYVGEELRGYHKPIMLAGGFGNVRDSLVNKKELKPGMLIIVLGGPSMLIGVGGGAASSMAASTRDQSFDFASVQRGDSEMQQRAQEVINHCIALGEDNPILAIHDVGAGGLSNAIPELIHYFNRGGKIQLDNISSIDPSLSPFELWCNESQERFVIGLETEKLEMFRTFALRENCPFSVVGEIISEPELKLLWSTEFGPTDTSIDIPLSLLFDVPATKRRYVESENDSLIPLNLEGIDIYDAAFRLLRLPTIADKSFLINICDRSISGLVCRDQMVGPWQVPVADCAVTAASYDSYHGEVMSMGERPPIALIDAAASARMAVGEAITNIAAASIGTLSDIRLSANWMAACGYRDEDYRLYEAVKALGLEFCPALNLTIPVGKDSLSMQTVWYDENDETEKQMTAPLSVIISAFAPVMDIRNSLTPELNKTEDTQLIFIDLSESKQRLGGSSLAYVYSQLGNRCPDVENPNVLKAFFNCIQQLNLEDKILAYHDRSDGGLFITLCEMAFASHCGLQLDVSALGKDLLPILFNEELGVVIQVRLEDLDTILVQLNDHGLTECYAIGTIDQNDIITFNFEEEIVFTANRIELQLLWSETSYRMQKLRDNPRTAKKAYESLLDREDPGLNVQLKFDPMEDITAPFVNVGAKPAVAILREQGMAGHTEMAAAFDRAGFAAMDVHINDIKNNLFSLSSVKAIAVCAGFSYGDTFGAGLGFAKRILFDSQLKDEFLIFFNRTDTFSLGVCNGCQTLAGLKSLIPGAELWPSFMSNHSEQFECRLSMVQVEASPSILFTGMEGSRLLVPIAHREGRAEFLNEDMQNRAIQQGLVTLRFVDSRGRKTKVYPANPNGSPLGITGLTTEDGRVTIVMPNPERAFRSVQYSWRPKNWGDEGPWLRMFRNGRLWLG